MTTATKQNFSLMKNPELQVAFALISIILMLFIQLPPFLLDFLLAVSIAVGFLILLVSVYIREPLEFSTFPTFLLISTLARLALNVATTRSILLNGAAGKVSNLIKAFGEFVIGGNYIVGFVMFLIIVIINFLVITKGAGRVAEVGARFTLDAMPGKQMSIDADLNAGIIDRDEAKRRRIKIEKEADFYGSMDGASKFVRGDAIASILITGINIVVGLAIGVLQYNMSFTQAAQVYTLLTVGDGLITQIPAIIISVASGIVVTRASGDSGLSSELSSQIFFNSRALYICSGLIFGMALIPGLPLLSVLPLFGFFIFMGRQAEKMAAKKLSVETNLKQESSQKEKKKQDSIESLLHVDTLSLEVGVGLIPLVDTDQDGEVLERIISARKQFAQDMGIIVPMIMVRDNVQLKAGEYQILLKGNVVAKGSLIVDCDMAMAPEEGFEPIPGIQTKEPAYGLDAFWIRSNQKEEAAFKGYTVVNCSTVIVTHITKIVGEHAHHLLGRQETQYLIDSLKEKNPKVVEEVLGSDGISLGTVVKVLQNLLEEGVGIRDLLSIFETLADHCKHTKHPATLTRYVRKSLGRSIVKKYLSPKENLIVCSLDRGVEDLLLSGLKHLEDGSTTLQVDPEIAQKILNHIAEGMAAFNKTGTMPILLCGSQLRWDLKKIVSRFIPGLAVIAFDEVPSDILTETVNVVSL